MILPAKSYYSQPRALLNREGNCCRVRERTAGSCNRDGRRTRRRTWILIPATAAATAAATGDRDQARDGHQ